MNRMLTLSVFALFATNATAADMPIRQHSAAPPPSPFYGFIDIGMGVTSQKNSLVIDGFDVFGQNPREFPTGFLVGGGFGVEFLNTAIGGLAIEARIHYNFDRASFGCGALTGCAGYTKNSWLAQELVYWAPLGTTPMAWTGWGWTQSLNIWFGGGAAERTVDACLFAFDGAPFVQAGSNSTICDTKFLVGWDAGLKIVAPLSADGRWKFRLTGDYIGYNQEVIHKNSLVFETPMTGTLAKQYEVIGLAGIQFNF